MTSVFTGSRRKFFGATNKREIIEALGIDPNAFRYDIISGKEDYSTKRYYNRGLISAIASFVKSGSGDIVEEYEVGSSVVFYATGSIARLGTTSGYKATIPSTPNVYMNADKRFMSIQDAVNAGGLVIKGDFSPVNPVDIYSLKLNEASKANITLTYKSAGYLMQESVMYRWNSESGKSEWLTSYDQKDPVAVVTTDGKKAVDFVGIDTTPLATLSEWGTVRSEVKDLSESGQEWSVTSTGEPYLNEIKSSDLRNNYSEVTLQTSYELEAGEYAIGISPDNFATSFYGNYNGINGPAHGMRPTAYELKIELEKANDSGPSSCEAQITYGKNVSGRLTDKERDIISGLLCKSGDYTGLVSSYNRTSAEQARVMLEGYFFAKKRNPSQTVNGGLKALRGLYNSKSGLYAIKQLGNALIGEDSNYITLKQAANIKSKLVSSLARGVDDAITNYPGSFKHVNFANGAPRTDQTVRAVDIDPSSIEDKSSKKSFIAAAFALKSAGVINEFLFDPSKENAYHIEFFLS